MSAATAASLPRPARTGCGSSVRVASPTRGPVPRPKFPLGLDPSSTPEADPVGAEAAILLDARAIDGDRIAAELRAGPKPGRSAQDAPAVVPGRPAVACWPSHENGWAGTRPCSSSRPRTARRRPAGRPRRLEYRFSAAARVGAKEATFGAISYDDGHLDWPDLSTGHRRLAAPAATPRTVDDVVIPVPLVVSRACPRTGTGRSRTRRSTSPASRPAAPTSCGCC